MCSNPRPPFDATIRLEHDGCDEFSSGDDWGQPDDYARMEDQEPREPESGRPSSSRPLTLSIGALWFISVDRGGEVPGDKGVVRGI
jgi:hypothetical protein